MINEIDLLITNVNVATMVEPGSSYGAIHDGCVGISGKNIAFVGKEKEFTGSVKKRFDGQGKWLLPGFVDCHTHIVYAGDRANEFEMRLNGISYQQISEQGGGIKHTVMATREASFDDLYAQSLARLNRLIEEGVTTLEVKSGYGLTLESEVKMLNVAKALSENSPINVTTTYLGAHALPPEYADNADGYIDYVCGECIPYIVKHDLAQSVDVFCESIGFTPTQCEKVFHTANQHGLQIHAHVEQLSNLEGAKLASKMGALSVDHIEFLESKDVVTLADNDTVAVLLPGAYYYLNETQKPPIDELRKQGVCMAVASDINPGSSPISSLLTCANMACVFFKLTPEEALKGITVHAAKALGMKHVGAIQSGLQADLCLWDIQHPAQLVYSLNQFRPVAKWFGGRHV